MSTARDTLETIVPLAVPIVTGIVAAAGLALKDHRLARDARSVRDRAFDEASSEVAFASEWWKAHQLLGTPELEQRTEQAQRWLAEAEAKVTSAQAVPVDERPSVTFRRLLLLYPMHGWQAKALKAVFLFFAAWLALLSLVLVVDPPDSAPGDREYEVIGLFMFTLVMLPIRAWAAAADARERHASPDEEPSSA